MQFLHQEEENKISLNVGIGTGGTMNDAEMNARRALDFSLKNAKQEIFWIDAGQTQHGPLGKEIQLEYYGQKCAPDHE